MDSEQQSELPEHPKEHKKGKKEQGKKPKPNPQKDKAGPSKKKIEGAALIGIDVRKEDNLADWYTQVLTKGSMISYYDVSGCYILEPSSYHVWETIQGWFNARIKKLGVKNCYFPIFISEANLTREKEHIEGFAAEVAWVTEGGSKKLDKRVAIRPTSETAMYGYFADKIRSHRDLPLKLNQWNNVIRWEFKHPMPFLRSREFLWQEGHTAHLTEPEADTEVEQILELYARIYEELLAVPMVRGKKTKNEQFPGAHYTSTVEGFIAEVGRGIQGGTSHCLGTHFSKMFNITVEDPSAPAEGGEKKPPIHVWQNSWGFTTRSIGVMILTHGDNKGLVIPPRVAEVQVIVVPVGITAKTTPEDRDRLTKETEAIVAVLVDAGVRAEADLRDNYSGPYKFNHWELKGVPLRLEFGPKDSAAHVVTTSRRDTTDKSTLAISDLATGIPALLEDIQRDLYTRADELYRAHRKTVTVWDDFVAALNAKNLCVSPHCLEGSCEDEIKEMSARRPEGGDADEAVDERAPSMGAKTLCIPFEQPDGLVVGESKCVNPNCGREALKWIMFGRSY